MALSPAEIQRAYRQRKKEALRAAADRTTRFIKRSFEDYLTQADAAGLVRLQEVNPKFRRELPRIEAYVDQLRQAAQTLAVLINGFELAEVDARLAELAQADLSDPAARTQALSDGMELTDIRRQLQAKERHEFHVVAVK